VRKGLAVAHQPTLRGRRRRTGTGFGIPPLRAGLGRNKPMYIGIGTIVIIVIIVLVVLMLRRLCPGRLAAWGGGLTEGRAHGGHDLSRLVQQGPEGFADGIADQFGEAVGPYRVLTGEPAVE
jgi:hypothetical protein